MRPPVVALFTLYSEEVVLVAKIYGPVEYRRADTRDQEPDQEDLAQKWGIETVLEPVKTPEVGSVVTQVYEI